MIFLILIFQIGYELNINGVDFGQLDSAVYDYQNKTLSVATNLFKNGFE